MKQWQQEEQKQQKTDVTTLAQHYTKRIKQMDDPEERKDFWIDKKEKRIISDEVDRQLEYLFENNPL